MYNSALHTSEFKLWKLWESNGKKCINWTISELLKIFKRLLKSPPLHQVLIKQRNLCHFHCVRNVKVWGFYNWSILCFNAVYRCIVLYSKCWCIVRFWSLYMGCIFWTEHVTLLYCIAIKSYWKPHTLWSFLAHQSDDRYTKCTEHLYTLPLGNAAVLYRSLVSNICGVGIGKQLKI